MGWNWKLGPFLCSLFGHSRDFVTMQSRVRRSVFYLFCSRCDRCTGIIKDGWFVDFLMNNKVWIGR